MKPPVKRHIGKDRNALLTFVDEAAHNGYRVVIVATDVAAALGAPTSTPIMVTVSRYTPEGLAVAFDTASLSMPSCVVQSWLYEEMP